MRPIDANELTEMVWRERVDSRELIANLIARQPTIKIDVQPIRHGRWINDGDCMLCSCCNYAYNSWFMGSNYCPNCGAHMIKGMKENECKS